MNVFMIIASLLFLALASMKLGYLLGKEKAERKAKRMIEKMCVDLAEGGALRPCMIDIDLDEEKVSVFKDTEEADNEET